MSKLLDALIAEVEQDTDILSSALKTIDSLAAAIAHAGPDPLRLQALTTELMDKRTALAAAIAAHTTPVAQPPTNGEPFDGSNGTATENGDFARGVAAGTAAIAAGNTIATKPSVADQGNAAFTIGWLSTGAPMTFADPVQENPTPPAPPSEPSAPAGATSTDTPAPETEPTSAPTSGEAAADPATEVEPETPAA